MHRFALLLSFVLMACEPPWYDPCQVPDCGRYAQAGCCQELGESCCDPGLELDVNGVCSCLEAFPGHDVDGQWNPDRCPSP